VDGPLPDHAHTPDLNEVGARHHQHLERAPDAQALEERNAARIARAAPDQRHQHAVVRRDAEQHGDGDEAAQGRRRDAHSAHGAVQRGALLHEQGVHLRPDGAGHQRGQPHRDHSDNQLHLLHLGHRARQPPRVRPQGRPVKERERPRVEQPPLPRRGVPRGVVLLQLGSVARKPAPPVRERLAEDPADQPRRAGCRVPLDGLVPVERRADVEEEERQREADGGDGVPDAPADVLLHEDEDEHGDKAAGEGAEHPPVEEGRLDLALPRVEVVELVRPERGDVGFGAARADGHGVERPVEEGHLLPRRRRAGTVRRALRVEGLERYSQRYQNHSLQQSASQS